MEKNFTLYSKTSPVSASEEASLTGTDTVVDITDGTIYPGDNIIKNILSFSKALKVVPSGEKSQIGSIEIVIN